MKGELHHLKRASNKPPFRLSAIPQKVRCSQIINTGRTASSAPQLRGATPFRSWVDLQETLAIQTGSKQQPQRED